MGNKSSVSRSDKRREIKATLPAQWRTILEARAQAVGVSAFAYARLLSLQALKEITVIRAFSPYFIRGYIFEWSRNQDGVISGETVIFSSKQWSPGDPERLLGVLPEGDNLSRFPIKYMQTDEEYERLAYLAYCLDCSASQAQTILLCEALMQSVELPTIPITGVAQ